MNRHYTPDEYYDIVVRLRKAFPDCAITTDIMVGFAGETDKEFEESCEFVRKVGFAAMHVFTYSIREGTAAAKRTDHVPHDVAVKRYHAMSKLANELKEAYFRSNVGKTERVLIQRRESEEYANGLTPQYVPVRIYGSDAKKQDIITVQITEASGSDFCVGKEIKCL
jgi:threonylcarbamoyladenosine tRNA methylthiotransferase MtaB